MVYYFTSTATDPPATIFVGKDKTENEDLIRYGWEEDVCTSLRLSILVFKSNSSCVYLNRFHADNLSSAHIYLRLTADQTWDSLPAELLEDCAQLTKANSIEGNKRDNVAIIYTPWSNLKKDGGMAVGQVGFHSHKKTKRIHVPTRTNAIVNRLNKTRTEIEPGALATQHLRETRDAHLAAKRKVANEKLQKQKKEEQKLAKDRRDAKERTEREWNDLYGDDRVQEEGRSNVVDGWDEDDFM